MFGISIDNYQELIIFGLLAGLVVYFIFTLYLYFKVKDPFKRLGIESEVWKYGDKELSILYKIGRKPAQNIIDEITSNIATYEKMVQNYNNDTTKFKKHNMDEFLLEGISFPVAEGENVEFDFSIDFVNTKNLDFFLVAYIKDGKVKKLIPGD